MPLRTTPPDVPVCIKCGKKHITPNNYVGCAGHISTGPRAGEPCGQSPAKNQKVCRYHGGASPKAKKAAERRAEEAKLLAQAEKEVRLLGLPTDVLPHEALLEEIKWTAGHVQWFRAKVQELQEQELIWGTTTIVDKGSGEFTGTDTTEAAQPSVWYELYMRERQHLTAVCSAALRAGVEERRVRLAEQQGDLVAQVIRKILDDLNLTPEQQEAVSVVVPRHLRLIAGSMAG